MAQEAGDFQYRLSSRANDFQHKDPTSKEPSHFTGETLLGNELKTKRNRVYCEGIHWSDE